MIIFVFGLDQRKYLEEMGRNMGLYNRENEYLIINIKTHGKM